LLALSDIYDVGGGCVSPGGVKSFSPEDMSELRVGCAGIDGRVGDGSLAAEPAAFPRLFAAAIFNPAARPSEPPVAPA